MWKRVEHFKHKTIRKHEEKQEKKNEYENLLSKLFVNMNFIRGKESSIFADFQKYNLSLDKNSNFFSQTLHDIHVVGDFLKIKNN